jgi:hypothetical protein
MKVQSDGDLVPLASFQEKHYPPRYWAERWGFKEKKIREWFRFEFGPGILREGHTGRRGQRSYTSLMISESAAARIYAKHCESREYVEQLTSRHSKR